MINISLKFEGGDEFYEDYDLEGVAYNNLVKKVRGSIIHKVWDIDEEIRLFRNDIVRSFQHKFQIFNQYLEVKNEIDYLIRNLH